MGHPGYGRATDSFVFDCGEGTFTNYSAMRVQPSRMDKVFLNHLHGDHMNDLAHIYWYGPAQDRKSPLYVWGPSSSGITCPAWGNTRARRYSDGTRAMCRAIRDAMRWATESFSFQTTSYAGYDTPTREGWKYPDRRGPVSDDPPTDGYALIPIELDWTKWGKRRGDNLAYHNPTTGVKITHFPVIHTRKGSVGYKLEWNGLSMVYTSDTKPEYHSIGFGSGTDVFVHEMILPADVLTMKNLGITDPSGEILDGGLHPRLGAGNITWSTDLMVIRVFPDKTLIQKGVVQDYTYSPSPGAVYPEMNPPKYDDHDPTTPYGDAYAQIDTTWEVPAVNRITGEENYRLDGY